MGELVRFLGQRLVVVAARRVGIEREVELVFPFGRPLVDRGVDRYKQTSPAKLTLISCLPVKRSGLG